VEVPGATPLSAGPPLLLTRHVDARRARRLRAAGRRVACLTADPSAIAVLGDALIVLGADAFVEWDLADSNEVPLIALVEAVYARLEESSPVPAAVGRALGTDDVAHFFRRTLFLDIAALLTVATVAAHLALADEERVVVDESWEGAAGFAMLLDLWRSNRFGDVPGLRLGPPLAATFDRLDIVRPRLLQRLRGAAGAVASSWLHALRIVKPLPRRRPKAPLLIRAYPTDFGVDEEGYPRIRNVDFIVDGERIQPGETAFWAEWNVSPERIDALEARGRFVTSRAKLRAGVLEFLRYDVPVLAGLTRLLPELARSERWWTAPVTSAIDTFLLWSHVARQAEPRAFLVFNDLPPSGTVRNLALRRHGCKTVQYQHSCHWRPDREGWIRDYVFAFAVVDAVATWGPRHSAHVLSHHGSIGEIWEVGCLWSEHARLCADDPALNRGYTEALAQHAAASLDAYERRVGVFDTSISLLDAGDLVAFHDGVERLARKLPTVLFLSKPKNPGGGVRDDGPSNLVELPNLFETAAIVGLTDLSISACFTSTAVEGMGCSRPALYYDPTGRFPDTFQGRIPGLVVESDDELERRVRELLWDTTREQYDAYLRSSCADLEGRFDGLAITRLRERLAREIGRG
jgi:hypothetical protein